MSPKSRKVKNPFTGRKIKVGSTIYKRVKKLRDLSNLNEVALKTLNPTTKRNVKVFGPAHLHFIYNNIALGQNDKYLDNYRNQIYNEDKLRKFNEDLLKVEVIENQRKLLKRKNEILNMKRTLEIAEKKYNDDVKKVEIIDLLRRNVGINRKIKNDA